MAGKKIIIETRANEFARRTSANRNIPYMPEELVEDAVNCRLAGASIYHFHARTADGAPATDPRTYAATVSQLRQRSDILIHPTLGYVAKEGDAQERLSHVIAMSNNPAGAPHFAPMDLGSLNVDVYDRETFSFVTSDQVYRNDTATLIQFAKRIRAAGLKPYLVSWNIGFTRMAGALMQMGLIDEPALLCFLMTDGPLICGHPCTLSGLKAHLSFLPETHRIEWTVVCSGASALPLASYAIEQGGHISIGLGDYHYAELGGPTNAKLVERIADMALGLGRPVASPEDVKAMLRMAP